MAALERMVIAWEGGFAHGGPGGVAKPAEVLLGHVIYREFYNSHVNAGFGGVRCSREEMVPWRGAGAEKNGLGTTFSLIGHYMLCYKPKISPTYGAFGVKSRFWRPEVLLIRKR
jgi:hypothetical protein